MVMFQSNSILQKQKFELSQNALQSQIPTQQSTQLINKKLAQPKKLIGSSNVYRLKQQIQILKSSHHQYKINHIGINNMQVNVKYQLQLSNQMIKNCVFIKQNKQFANFIIILHQKYPWAAPYVICTTQNIFPRLDDYRDYLQDAIGGQWWPVITISKILDGLQNLVNQKILHLPSHQPQLPSQTNLTKIKINSSIKACFQLGKRTCSSFINHSLELISQYCHGIKLCQGKYFHCKQVFVGKYYPQVIGISWTHILIFKELLQPNQKQIVNINGQKRYTIICSWKIQDIRKIQLQKTKINTAKQRSSKKSELKKEDKIFEHEYSIELINGRQQYITIEQYSTHQQTNANQVPKQKHKQIPLQLEKNRKNKQQRNINFVINKKINNQTNNYTNNNNNNNNDSSNIDTQGSNIAMTQSQNKNKILNVDDSLSHISKNKNQQNLIHKDIDKINQQHQITNSVFNSSKAIKLLKLIIEYLQARENIRKNEISLDKKINILSSCLQNSSEFQEEIQLHIYYQCKLKEIIGYGYAINNSIPSNIKFSI